MPKKLPTPARKRAANKPTSAAPPAPVAPATGSVDDREQTFNAGATGPVQRVSTPADLITSVRAILLDVDPKFIKPTLYAGTDGTAAERLYAQTARHWLDRHPLLKDAEVRLSGTGLHVLLRLEPAVEFGRTNDRDRWAIVTKIVQSTLPSDPNAPGLTALTRPVGSTSGKSGRVVVALRPGSPVRPDAVLGFVAELQQKPFATVARVLYGRGTIRPCPVCRAADSSLKLLDRVGRCYGCGEVTVAQLLGAVMADPADTGGK